MGEMKVLNSLSALVKPTLETTFHIDYDWWDRNNVDISVELRSHLCEQHREAFGEKLSADEKIDWVDEETGEVRRVNGLQHIMRVHCSKQSDYINDDLPLVDAVFRAFLASGNRPMTPKELAGITDRLSERILRTLAGKRVYKGIRPIH